MLSPGQRDVWLYYDAINLSVIIADGNGIDCYRLSWCYASAMFSGSADLLNFTILPHGLSLNLLLPTRCPEYG
jgi:hypothetical protein